MSHFYKKELMTATHVMQSFFNELSTPVSDNVKYKQTKVITNALNSQADVGSPIGWEEFFQSDVK